MFVQVIDPVGSGFVESMARPGGNVTGFTQFEYSLAGKWLELLKEIAPRRDTGSSGSRSDARPRHWPVRRDPGDGAAARGGTHADQCERSHRTQTQRIAAFAASPNGGLIVTVGGSAFDRDAVIAAAAKNDLLQSIPIAISQPTAASFPMVPIRSNSIVAPPATLTVY